MAERTFPDDDGRTWKVWHVTAQDVERRAKALDVEALRDTERRIAPRRSRERVPERLRGGWLTFAHADQRRRVAPVPEDFPSCDDARLRELLRASEVVPLLQAPELYANE